MARPIPPSEIANFIDKHFINVKVPTGSHQSGMLQAVVDMIKTLDPAMLPSGPQSRADLLAAISHIEYQIGLWSLGGSQTYVAQELPQLKKAKGQKPLAVIRGVLEQCYDTIVPEEIPGLEFVDDDDVREGLRMDLAEIEASINQGQWKSATVLGGSLIEALLLDKLISESYDKTSHYEKIKSTRRKDPNDWSLSDCLEIAIQLSKPLIEKDTYKAATLAKDYRNFIHPGRVRKEGKSCKAGFAYNVKGAIFRVIEDLEDRFG